MHLDNDECIEVCAVYINVFR